MAKTTFARRIWNNIGFLTLFTILTSTSLNCVTLVRERREEKRLHELQCGALMDLYKKLQSIPNSSSSRSSKITFDQQKMIIKRFQSLKIDPNSIGFANHLLPKQEDDLIWKEFRDRHTSWSQALFGSGFIGKLRNSLNQTFSRIRGNEISTNNHDQIDELSQKAEEEWIRALEESEEGGPEMILDKEEEEAKQLSSSTTQPQQFKISYNSDRQKTNTENQKSWFSWRSKSDQEEKSQRKSNEEVPSNNVIRRRIII